MRVDEPVGANVSDVVNRLLAQAALRPSGIAVAGPNPTTYAAFVGRAAGFATCFGDLEAPRVLIAVEKGVDAYAAMFGTLMAGGTYAPVNVSSPHARLTRIAEAFDPDFIVAAPPLDQVLAEPGRGQVVDPADPPRQAAVDMRPAAAFAYVIFTSGSTGEPKGVAIPQTALAHYVAWLGPAMGIGPNDRMSQHPNIGFDLSVLDIYGALCFGAALHPFVTSSARLLPARKIREEAITIWNSVPSVVSLMDTAGELDAAHLASVRLFTFCGEVLRRDQVARLFAARPNAVVFNTYGPTEATVAMTYRRLVASNHDALCRPSAPLGEPIGDMRLHLMGDGDEGEIVISGPQVAAGYWGDEALTATKFRTVTDENEKVRAFFTGDYATRIDGELYFLGRRDDMVKLRGHRIHLSEICNAFQKIGWATAFVFEKGGEILAVVERTDGLIFDEARILEEILGLLDTYSVPVAVRLVDRFPRSANDKVDGAALKTVFDRDAGPVSGDRPVTP